MGFGGGSSSPPANTTTTTINQPPAYVEPYGQQALQKGVELSQQPYQAYTGQQIAPLTPEHQYALSAITSRAVNGSPTVNFATGNANQTLANNYLDQYQNPYLSKDTAAGAYLNSNPYLDATYNKAARGLVDQYKFGIAPQIGRQFGHMQAFGNNSGYNESMAKAQEGLATGLGDLATNVYGTNYQNERARMEAARQGAAADYAQNYQGERGRQIQTMALAPQLASQQYTDAQALLGAGDIQRQTSQDQLNLDYQKWLQQQQYPYQQLDVLSNAIRGAIGGGTQTTTAPNPYQPSPTASMLGGGLAGAGIASLINPAYAGYGAAGGALLPWIFK